VTEPLRRVPKKSVLLQEAEGRRKTGIIQVSEHHDRLRLAYGGYLLDRHQTGRSLGKEALAAAWRGQVHSDQVESTFSDMRSGKEHF
jgi:hypothetical protein